MKFHEKTITDFPAQLSRWTWLDISFSPSLGHQKRFQLQIKNDSSANPYSKNLRPREIIEKECRLGLCSAGSFGLTRHMPARLSPTMPHLGSGGRTCSCSFLASLLLPHRSSLSPHSEAALLPSEKWNSNVQSCNSGLWNVLYIGGILHRS